MKVTLLVIFLVGCASSPPRDTTVRGCRAEFTMYCENLGGDERCTCVDEWQLEELLDDLYEW